MLALGLGAAPWMSAQDKSEPIGYDDTPQLPGQPWRVHDGKRPRPAVVRAEPGAVPSDAVVLFDGKDLSKWQNLNRGKAGDAAWKVGKGYFEVVPGTGHLISREKFSDCQIHVEWATPNPPKGNSQARGNSGVLIMSRYEIQVLDSYDDITYADGQAASIYGQWPPLVNASRKPGVWQTYDIAFEAPVFENGKVSRPAYATVFHNGVLVHHHKAFVGAMRHRVVGVYEPHGPEEPLMLQGHNNPVRYRNVWVRRIRGYDQA
jgi:hypothetical protein